MLIKVEVTLEARYLDWDIFNYTLIGFNFRLLGFNYRLTGFNYKVAYASTVLDGLGAKFNFAVEVDSLT